MTEHAGDAPGGVAEAARRASRALRERPERVVLPARDPSAPDARPPVRIFLGTEPSQHRAERVFVWSVERVRDRERRYEIHLMKDLAGFDRRGWTTGFTNYRFAIPHFAGGAGRAIYNDVDQIYLADPAELFDRDLGGHGFLAISESESSVMLLDCARMARVWTLAEARTGRKGRLLRRALPLRGPLDPAWNARDGEYAAERSKLLHFTTLHTQPWRPFPERFVYEEHPQSKLWHALEREAADAGFQVFTRERPSARFASGADAADAAERRAAEAWTSRAVEVALREVVRRTGARSVRVLGSPPAPEARAGLPPVETATLRDALGSDAPTDPTHDGVACTAGLEWVPEDDVPWVLDALFRRAERFVLVAVACDPRPRRGGLLHPTAGDVGGPGWWEAQLAAASRRHRGVHWELVTRAAGVRTRGAAELRIGGRFAGEDAPRVWVLTDDRPGNTTQSLALAEALGWPAQRKELRFNALARLHNGLLGASRASVDARRSSALAPPWPDLVIAAGRRTAPVARWIRRASGGRARIVQLGRKGANPAEAFDLAVTPEYARLVPHPRRVEVAAPLVRVAAADLAEAGRRWKALFEGAPSPRIAVLVGGASRRHPFAAEEARRMGRDVAALAERAGGSLFVTTSRRTPPESVAALRHELPQAVHFHRWTADAPPEENPYRGYLALADAFVVTGESESMLAEACATGRPVAIVPLRERRRGLGARMAEAVVRRAHERPPNRRGTTRPQRGLELLCARLLARGWVRPPRDLGRMHRRLVREGRARILDGGLPAAPPPETASDLERVVRRVRALVGVGPPPARDPD